MKKMKKKATTKNVVKKSGRKAVKKQTPAINYEPIVVKRHRLYCRGCGNKLILTVSKELGFCRFCAKFCISCGQRKSEIGAHGVCLACVAVINSEIMECQKLERQRKGGKCAPSQPVSANCVCGDPATKELNGVGYCDDCYAEKTDVGPENVGNEDE